MQDWAWVGQGRYDHVLTEGEMRVAFDRAAALLRRPVAYSLTADSLFREAPGPGALLVEAGPKAAISGGVSLILDASGSMLKRMDGERRIQVARRTLKDAVTEHLPAGTPVSLRVFGHRRPGACDSELVLPLAPLEPGRISKVLDGINAMNLAKTPIAESLELAARDLSRVEGRKSMLLLTDGEETCDGDPAAVIEKLRESGVDLQVNIVGFAIGDEALARQFEAWARAGGGRYFDAADPEGLRDALAAALAIPFTVWNSAGEQVAEGVVGGEPVPLPAGFYRVQLGTGRGTSYEKVEVVGEKTRRLTVE
jgi:hypothetical protein